ncbi:MAG: hypothetical protein H6613_19270 [Ignavibacteriales bacterium]|nr:hypothetical protein [Ignavibacteriales bacterium]
MKRNNLITFILSAFFLFSCSSESIVKDETIIIPEPTKTDTVIVYKDLPKKILLSN